MTHPKATFFVSAGHPAIRKCLNDLAATIGTTPAIPPCMNYQQAAESYEAAVRYYQLMILHGSTVEMTVALESVERWFKTLRSTPDPRLQPLAAVVTKYVEAV